MTRLTSIRTTSLAFLLILLLFSSQQTIVAQTDTLPSVRVVHLVPDGPAFDLYLDEITPAIFQNIRYGDATRLFQTQPGLHDIAITAAGTPKETAVINQQATANKDSSYTVMATGQLSALDLQPIVLARGLHRTPTPGATLMRVFHGSRAAGDVDITITDVASKTTSFDNFSFRSATTYQSLPAGNIRVEVSEPGGDLLYTGTGIIPQGSLLTVIAAGDPSAGTFKLYVLSDNSEQAKFPMDTLRAENVGNDGLVRLVHVSPLVGNLKIAAVDDVEDNEDIEYQWATETTSDLDADTNAIVLWREGESADMALLTKNIDIVAKAYRAYFIVGDVDAGTFDLLSLTADITATPPVGQSSVRVLNAALDTSLVDIEIEFSNGTKRMVSSSGFRGFTPYQLDQAGLTTVRLTRLGESEPFITVQGMIPSNTFATLIIVGDIESSGLGVRLLVDSDNDEQKPMIAFESPSGVEWEREIITDLRVRHHSNADDISVRFSLLQPTVVKMELYGVAGEQVGSYHLGHREQGEYTRQFDVRSIPNGWYLMIMRNNEGRIIARERLSIRR